MGETSFSAEMGNASPISGFVMGPPSAKTALMNPRRRAVSFSLPLDVTCVLTFFFFLI